MTEEELLKLVRITQTEAVAMGLFEWAKSGDGIVITEKGKEIARQHWARVSAIDRLLFGWYTKEYCR